MTELQFIVREAHQETPVIKSFRIAAANGAPLPRFASGAHIKIHVPGLDEPRSYSLFSISPAASTDPNPAEYRLAVRLEQEGRGGSSFMHTLAVGQSFNASGPKNDFPLHCEDGGKEPVILIAGGIGITPIASHAAALSAAGRSFVLHYSGRSLDQLALLDELKQQHGENLVPHADNDPATCLDLTRLLQASSPSQHIYVCGPKGMIDAVIAEAGKRGWPREKIHFELFAGAAPMAGDQAFELELRQSGRVLQVPADKTILEILEAAGCDPMVDCRRGECGVCQVVVLEGIPDHRDYFLTDREKANGKVIQTCVSRARSARLTLDM